MNRAEPNSTLFVNAADNGRSEPARNWRFPSFWWLVTAFWLFIALALALEMAIFQSADIGQSLLVALFRLAPWCLLTPLVVWVSSAYPLERTTWRSSLGAQLVVCGISLALLGILAYLSPAMPAGTLPGTTAPPQPASQARDIIFLILKRMTYQLPVYCGLVGVAHAVQFYERSRQRERREAELMASLAQARLQALRMQLNPHFLFNTLNSIASLVQDQPQAEEMIESLSDLLRLALNTHDRQVVPLREELFFVDRYLGIERVRFGERLQIDRDLELTALDAMVPTLILQPLVENAVKHGIESQLAPGRIQLTARREGDTLFLEVRDNGRGLGSSGSRPGEGVGLSNTRARLKELYGQSAELSARPAEEQGFVAQIRLPFQTADAPSPSSTPSAVAAA
jgi:hypothetical protein